MKPKYIVCRERGETLWDSELDEIKLFDTIEAAAAAGESFAADKPSEQVFVLKLVGLIDAEIKTTVLLLRGADADPSHDSGELPKPRGLPAEL